jgi:hypothetical protein
MANPSPFANEYAARKTTNRRLASLPNYHPFIPLADIDAILTQAGFNATEDAIYCGREGRSTEKVGENTWLSLTWYKMEVTGNYEIVAYVS